MNVLIIDDWQHRHAHIEDRLCRSGKSIEFEHRFSPQEATPADYQWADVLFLDHDMCTAMQGEPCPNPNGHGKGSNSLNAGCGCPTGMDVVRALLRAPKRPHVVVHSGNLTAGRQMVKVLRANGISAEWSPVTLWPPLLTSTLYKIWRLPECP